MIFLEPVLAVGEEEVEHLVLAVIEAEGVPCRVFAAGVGIEVCGACAVDACYPLVLVLHGVGVHDVHYHGDAEFVGAVDEAFQLLGGAEARRCGEEVAHVVAERAVVGVFLDGHYLYGIVAVGGDARKHVVAEFGICAHPFALLGHADVALIYK